VRQECDKGYQPGPEAQRFRAFFHALSTSFLTLQQVPRVRAGAARVAEIARAAYARIGPDLGPLGHCIHIALARGSIAGCYGVVRLSGPELAHCFEPDGHVPGTGVVTMPGW
jgi:hypothetical protein